MGANVIAFVKPLPTSTLTTGEAPFLSSSSPITLFTLLYTSPWEVAHVVTSTFGSVSPNHSFELPEGRKDVSSSFFFFGRTTWHVGS